MALEYNNSTQFETLAPVLEDYAGWFGRVALCVAYHEENSLLDKIATPSSFADWLVETRNSASFAPEAINGLDKLHEDMLGIAEKLITILQTGERPSIKDFAEFKNTYTGFLSRIRRLEKDSALEKSSIDEPTGLRSQEAIKNDLKREMDRVSRQGNPFSLLLTRIDAFDYQSDQKRALEIAVANIKYCMRSFDDAYYMGQGHFLISLKHADMIGGLAAVSRLQQALRKDKDNAGLTMSYSLVEPISGDDAFAIIKHMRQDLDDHAKETDCVLKFKEVSPLERFVSAKGAE